MKYIHEKILYTKISKFQNKYKLTYRYSINKLLKDLGVQLTSYEGIDFPALMAISEDAFSVMENGKRYIFYNPFHIESRINFSLAHELGHFVLEHHKYAPNAILAFGDFGIFEAQANIFARNLLMPIERVEDYLKIKNIEEIAEIFEVSQHMTRIRLQVLEEDIRGFSNIKI